MENSNRTIHVELRSLNHRIHRFFQNSPNKRAVDSVTGTNSWIICYLANHEGRDIFQKDIEKEFDITRSTASKVIDLMEQKGLVVRQKGSTDRRENRLILTEKALEMKFGAKETVSFSSASSCIIAASVIRASV